MCFELGHDGGLEVNIDFCLFALCVGVSEVRDGKMAAGRLELINAQFRRLESLMRLHDDSGIPRPHF